MSNSTQELIKKIRQQQSDQEAIIEQELQKKLMTLLQGIEQRFATVRNVTNKNMDALEIELQKFKFKPWIYPLIASLMLVPTIYASAKFWDAMIAAKMSKAETLEKTLEEHNKALRAIGTAGIIHAVRDGRLLLLLPKGAKEPKTWKNPHGQWVLDLGE